MRRFMVPISVVLSLVAGGCSRPNQVAHDPDCLKAVDALWTAVTSKRTDLLQQTDQELRRLEQSGQLSQSGHAELDVIIEMADAGRWTDAAQQLKWFMNGQQRQR